MPENVINNLGYRFLGQEKVEEAVAIFRANVERYPGSANVWDSLGEGLEAAGDLAAARDSYAKAVRIGREIDDPNVAIYAQHLATAEAALAGQR
mgnify:CR=1 FL=1